MGNMGTMMPGGFNPAMMQQFGGGTMPQMQGFNAGTMPQFGMMTGGDGQLSQQQQMLQVMQQQMQQMQQLQQQMQGGMGMTMQGQGGMSMQHPQQQNMQQQLPQQQGQQQQQQQQMQQQQQQMQQQMQHQHQHQHQPQQQMQQQMQPPQPQQQQMSSVGGNQSVSEASADGRPRGDAFDSMNDTGKVFKKCVETLSETEKEYYALLWDQAGCVNNTLQGRAAFDFLSKSKLPREILKRIWDLSDWKKQFYLGWEEFVVTMKLIAAAQKKQHVSLERLEYNCPTSMDCPEFEGVENVQAMLAKKAPRPAAETTGPTSRSNAFDAFGELMGDLPEQSAAPQPLFLQPAAQAAPEVVQQPTSAIPSGYPTGAAATAQPPTDLSSGATGAPPPPPSTTSPEFGDFSFQPAAAQNSPVPASPPQPKSPSIGGFAAFSAAGSDSAGAVGADSTAAFAASPTPAAAPSPSGPAPAWDAFGDDEPSFASAPAAATAAGAGAAPAQAPASPAAPATTSNFSSNAPSPSAAGVGGDWDAFGGSGFDAPKPDTIPTLAPAPSAATGGGDWAAFDAGSPAPASGGPAEGTWASFEASPTPAAPADDKDEPWDAFGSSPAPAAPAPPTGPAGGGEGDLWSKMSAFDDLMVKDEPAPAPSAAAIDGTAPPAVPSPSQAKAPDSFDPLGSSDDGGPTATSAAPAPAPTSPDFGADFDFQGPAAAPAAAPQPASSAFAAFDEDDDDFGNFDGGAETTSPPVTSEAPKPTSNADLNLSDMDFPTAAPTAEAEKASRNTADWAFGFGDDNDAKKEQAFQADFGDFSAPQNPATSSDFGNFGDFGSPEPAAKSAGDFGNFGSFPAPPSTSTVAGGASGGASAPSAVWADFAGASAEGANDDFGDFSGPQENQTAPRHEVEESATVKTLQSLAKELALQGHLEEARACQVGIENARKMDGAESKRKDLASKGKFEEALAIKKDLEASQALVPTEDKIEAWRRLSDFPAANSSMSSLAERLEQRCQCIDSDLDRGALLIALDNFRASCPPAQLPTDVLAELPMLLGKQRAAKRMSRAIEAAISGGLLKFLQVLVVCLASMSEIVGSCAEQLLVLTGPDWSAQDRADALASAELEEFLRGLATIRRILWRVGQAAGLFLPGTDADGTRDASLEDTLGKLRSSLDKAQATWATAESALKILESGLKEWDPDESFEAVGKSEGSANAPLCTLCLLPALPPFSMEANASHYDGGAASSLWKGGLWHLQCANFWVRHGSQCETLKELGLGDPFQQQNAFDF